MKINSGILVASSLVAAAMLSAVPASAATFVDTGTQTGNNGGGPTLATYQYLAGRFTLSSASVLTDVVGYIGSSNSNTIRVALRADSGSAPGGTLFSSTFTALTNGTSGAWQGVSSQNWAVGAGTYWISFENLTGESAYMPASAPNPLSAYTFSSDQGANWRTGTLNFGLRIMGSVAASAVPEPASWAMMIVGIGVVGGAMRRRQRTTVRFA